MPYNINDYSPTYGGIINSSGNVVNSGDTINTANEVKVAVGENTRQIFSLQNAATAVGVGTPALIEGLASLYIRVVITGSATVLFEASPDNVTFTALSGYSTANVLQSSTTATGEFKFNVTNLQYFQARISVFGSGTVTVNGWGSAAPLILTANMTTLGGADAAATSTLVQPAGALNFVFNGSTWDRQRTASADALAATGLTSAGNLIFNGSTWDRRRSASSDALSSTGLPSSGLMGYNGTTWDRVRTAGLADGAASTGILANGLFAFNGTSWDKVRIDANKNLKVAQSVSAGMSDLLTFQSGATAVGNGTPQDVSGYTTLSARVTISGTATVVFEGSADGTNFNALTGIRFDAVVAATFGGTTDVRFNIAGLKSVRARISVYTSGTVDVTGYVTTGQLISPPSVSTTFGSSDTNSATHIIKGVGAYNLLFDGTNWTRQRTVSQVGDGVTGTGSLSAGLIAFNGTNWDRVRAVNGGQLKTTLYSSTGVEPRGDATSDGSSGTGAIATSRMGWAGASFDRVRVGKVYKYIEYLNLANATATTVWTPAAGKKFRLMGVSISVSGTNAAVHLRDGAGGTVFHTVRATGTDTKEFSFGNGYLSGLADRVLEIYNLTGSTINVHVTAWGTEE